MAFRPYENLIDGELDNRVPGKTTWKEFLTRHWDQIVASDFFTIEVWTRKGLQRYLVLFFHGVAHPTR